MLTAQELRIGNFVSVPHYQGGMVEKKVVDIKHYPLGDEKDRIAVGFFTQEQFYLNVTVNAVEPIPLTEEWLLKFGFEKGKNSLVFALGKFEFDITSMQLGFGDPFGYHVIRRRIEYVHQLQNLFFALCGKELELKKDDWKEVTNRQGETFKFKPLPPT